MEEMEHCLMISGDEVVGTAREHTEPLYDGVAITKHDSMGNEVGMGLQAIDFPGGTDMFVAKHHINNFALQAGDRVRFTCGTQKSFANQENLPEVNFLDRLTGRGVDPRNDIVPPNMREKDPQEKGPGRAQGKSWATPNEWWTPQQQQQQQQWQPSTTQGSWGAQSASSWGGAGGAAAPAAWDEGWGTGGNDGSWGGGARASVKRTQAGFPTPTPHWTPRPPQDDGKPVYEGRICHLTTRGEAAFIKCKDTEVLYGKDVYMWNSYFKQAYLQDVVRFKVHLGSGGMPQVCWLEKISGPSASPTSNFTDAYFYGTPAEGPTALPRAAPMGGANGYGAPGVAEYSAGAF